MNFYHVPIWRCVNLLNIGLRDKSNPRSLLSVKLALGAVDIVDESCDYSFTLLPIDRLCHMTKHDKNLENVTSIEQVEVIVSNLLALKHPLESHFTVPFDDVIVSLETALMLLQISRRQMSR